ncbi:MAG: hypothetical protein R3E65_10255 [Steroidobacteraceae bacterium]
MKRFFDRLLQRNASNPKVEPKPPGARPTAGAGERGTPRVNAYQAVEIVPCLRACEAAREITGTRFLARRAPVLPLGICDRKTDCTCRFRKHDDRRVGPQRNPYASELVRAYPGQDRRRVRGRRSTDR